MKQSLAILFLVIAVMSCKPGVPSDYIQPDDMEDILYDYHVAQAMARETGGQTDVDYRRRAYLLSVLRKHRVTEADFDSSLVYYYSHADRLKNIYHRVSERLNDEAKALGASVGEIGRYSGYSATGDTANVWTNETDVVLIPRPTANRFDFRQKADTSYRQGDSFMFQFMTEYLYQSGTKDAVACVVAKYEGDSITQTVNHVNISGTVQMRIPVNKDGKLKEIVGFIYLNGDQQEGDVRRLMFINQIQLIRFHQQKQENDGVIPGEAKTDSLPKQAELATPQTTAALAPQSDSLRKGVEPLREGKLTPPTGKIGTQRMPEKLKQNQPLPLKERP